MSRWEQRWHPLREEWVIVAAHRQNRPWSGEMVRQTAVPIPPYAPDCYLCPGNRRVSGAQNLGYTSIFVFDNDHTCVDEDAPADLATPTGIYRNRPATGIARVICYSPRHNLTLAELPLSEVENLIGVWQRETVDLGQRPFINHVAGAPCGIMDQMTVVSGQPNQLLALLCQPAEIQGMIAIPDELAFWGVDSGIRHAVSGADYGSVRAGAFMGYKILQTVAGQDWGGYLANLGPSEFEQKYHAHLPERMAGADFLREYGAIPDGVTAVSPQQTYAIRQLALPVPRPVQHNLGINHYDN